jgi:O-antigen ligase
VTSRVLAVRAGGSLTVAVTTAGLVVAGYAAAAGYGPLVLAVGAAIACTVGMFVRPAFGLLALMALLLGGSRPASRVGLGGLYITELILVLLVAATAAKLVHERPTHPGVRFTATLLLLIWAPAVAGLLFHTELSNHAWARNFAIVYYSTFALLAALLRPSARLYRGAFAVALGAGVVALLIVFSGNGGSPEVTTTGAVRIASGSFALPFGVALLALLAGVMNGVVSKRWLVGALPFFVGLVLIQHRSAWLGLGAALAALVAVRLTPAMAIAVSVVCIAVIALASSGSSQSSGSFVGSEVARVRSINDTADANAHYRIEFWNHVLQRSAGSPVVGLGFDDYPFEIVPTHSSNDLHPEPHNSFIGLAYRIGLLPLVLLLGVLGTLVVRGFALARTSPDPTTRAALATLTSIVVYIGILSSFNVSLEVPYSGPIFWTAVGLLATAVFGERARRASGAA